MYFTRILSARATRTSRAFRRERSGLATLTVLALLIGLGFVSGTAVAETGAPAQGYIVTFDGASTAAEQQAALADAGAAGVDGVAPLDLYSATLDGAGVDLLRTNPHVTNIELDKVREVQAAPNDPGYDSQWALPQIGWDAAYGSVQPQGSSTVAVLDTGVNPTDDLAGNLVPGASMVDGADGTDDPNGHGTEMASIVAARTDDGAGIAGVGYAGVSVMPVKVLGADGQGQDSDIVAGVVYAADHGADVILMSFSNPGRSDALQAAADYAWSKGVVLVAATGNDSSSVATYPAGLAKVVGVSATTRDDSLWSGSNSGDDTFLAAPGVDIASGSGSVTGTSASAAIVAGSAALVKANSPAASNGVVVGRLARNADPAGTTAETGNGRLNLARSLADDSTDPVVPQGVAGNGGPVVGPYVAASVGIQSFAYNASTLTLTTTVSGSNSQKVYDFIYSPPGGGATINDLCKSPSGGNLSDSLTLTTSSPHGVWSVRLLEYPGGQGCGGNSNKDVVATATAGVQNTAPVAVNDSYSTTKNTALTVAAPGILANDTDADHDTLSVVSPASLSTGSGSLNANADGSFTFTPANNFTGSTTFQYRVTDGVATSANLATVTITVGAGAATTTSVPNQSVTYGATSVNLTASVSSAAAVNSGTVTFTVKNGATTVGTATTSATVSSGAASVSYALPAGTNAGTYTVQASYNGTTLSDSSGSGTLTVGKKGLTVTGANASRQYGVGNPALTFNYSGGFVGSDTAADIDTVPSCSSSATASSSVGSYQIVCSGAVDNNYSFTYVDGTLSVAARAITVTAAAQSKIYGQADPALGYSITSGSLVAGDNLTGGLARAVGENVGSYAINQGSLSAGTNYAITFVGNNLTIGRASLSVTADFDPSTPAVDHFTKVYGSPNPAFSARYVGLANGDSPSSLGGNLSFSTAVNSSTGVGSFAVTPTGLTSSNYNISYGAGAIDVTQRPITVTADPQSKAYGDADPALTYQVTSGSLAGTDAFTGALNRASGQNVGSYAIGQGTLSAGPNYNLTFVGANLTINKAVLNVNAQPASKTYGDADPSFTWTYSGFQNSDAVGSTTINGNAACTRASGQGVGTYTITCAPGTLSSANYSFATGTTANLTINKAVLNVNAQPASKTYGDADPSFTWTYSGFQNSDAVGSTTINGNAACTRASGQGVGTYTITCAPGTLSSANYSFATGTTANLTINKAVLNVNAQPASKTYGDADPSFTWTYSGFQNSDAVGSTTINGNAACTRASGQGVGTYTITCAPGTLSAANYSFATGTTANLTINKAVLNVNARPASKTYGDADPSFTWTYSGFQNSDAVGSTTINGNAACTRASGQGVGTYTITCAPGTLSSANYSFATGTTANLTINKAVLNVNAQPASKTYGDADPSFTWTYSGFQNSDAVGSTTINGNAACTRASGQGVGTYTITCAPGTLSAANYSFATGTTANLTINKAVLNVNAQPASKTYGDADPSFTWTYSGFQNSDAVGSTTINGNAACTRASGQGVGTYTITCAPGTLSAANYSFATGTTANLTVGKKSADVTADNQSKTYGQDDPDFTYSATGLVGDDSLAQVVCDVAGGHVNAGSYDITCSGNTNDNYSVTYHKGTLTVGKKSADVTADNQSKTYGQDDPDFTYSATGLVGDDSLAQVVCDVAGGHVNAGSYDITCSGNTNDNYSVTYHKGTLTVGKKSADVTADNQSKTYGQDDPDFTYSATGLVGDDSLAQVVCDVAGGHVNAGSYDITCSGNTNDNYSVTYHKGTLTVGKKSADVTADNQSKTYGQDDPDFTYSATGLVGDDSLAQVVCDVAGGHVNAGSYDITCSGNTNDNYSVTYHKGTLTVGKKSADVTADNQSKTYGQDDPDFTYSATGLVGDDSLAQVVCDVAGGHVNAGSYDITCSGNTNDNYSVTYHKGTLTVGKKSADVTADNQSKTYGQDDPDFTYSATGLVGDDSLAQVVCDVAGGHVNAGSYDITCSGNTNDNYSVTYHKGTLTVGKKSADVTADNQSKTYGQDDPDFTYSATGLVGDDSLAQVVCDVAGGHVNAGSYDITCSGNTNDNYSVTYHKGTLTVGKKSADVTADNQSKTYGQDDPDFTYSATGLVGDDSLAQVVCDVAGGHVNAGSYDITCSGNTNDNYSVTYHKGTLTVGKKSADVTADNQSKTYGQDDPDFTYSATGLVGDDSLAQVVCDVAGGHVNAGSYDITCSGNTNDNYSVTYHKGTLTVGKKSADVTADNQSKTYGQDDPDFTYSATGLVGDDSLAQVVCDVAGGHVNAGSYDITCSGNTNDNYSVTYHKGTLTVGKKSADVTADNQSKTYGQDDPDFTYSATGLVGDDSLAQVVCDVAGGHVNAGSYDITCSGNTNDNYSVTYHKGTLTVGKKSADVTADNQSKTYGQDDPDFTYSATGLVGDDSLAQVVCDVAGGHVNAGSYDITCSGNTNDNYSVTYHKGTLTVGKKSADVTADNQSKTYGQDDPDFTYSATGLVGDDSLAQVVCDVAGGHVNAGSYDITCSGNTNDNYSVTYHKGTLTVGKKSADVTADNQSKTYGQDDPDFTYSATGLVGDDSLAQVVCDVAGGHVNAGSYDITCSGNTNDNYSVTYHKGTLTVGKKSADVTADNQSKTYGQDDPDFTYSATGLVGDDSLAQVVCDVAGGHVNAGSYDITCSGNTNDNYSVTYHKGTLTVGKKSADVTADNQSKTYGQDDPDFTYSATGLVGDDSLAQVVCDVAGGHVNAGSYDITCSGNTNDNYSVTYHKGTLTVGKKSADVTADNQSKTYGQDDPDFTYSATGLVGDDSLAQVVCDVAGGHVNAGSYDITCSGNTNDNYSVTYHKGTLTVGKKSADVTADNQSKTYGQDDPDFTYSATGLVGDDSLAQVVCDVAGGHVNAGSYDITCSGNTNDNYSVTYHKGTLTVGKKSADVTADNQSKTYGQDDPDFTYSATGLVGDDSLAQVVCDVAGGHVNAGSYDITCSGNTNDNYSVTYHKGTLTVGKKSADVTADNQSKTYGQDDPDFTYSATGLVGDDSLAQVVCDVAGGHVNAGSYDITCSGNTNDNYSVTYHKGTLTVGKKSADVTADNQSKTYGQDDPDFTYSATGLVGDDSLAQVVCDVAGGHVNAGSYDITCSGNTNDNYSVTYHKGTLTVGKKSADVTADNQSKTYGQDDPDFTYSATGLVGDDSLAQVVCDVAGGHVNAGSYDITCSGNTNDNYSVTYHKGTLTVGKKQLSVTADDKSREYGAASPSFTATITGFANSETLGTSGVTGTPSCSTAAVATSPVNGSTGYPITCSLGGLAAGNYSFGFVGGKLTVTKKQLTVTADDKSREYGAASPSFTATITGFANSETLGTSGVTGTPSCSTAAVATSPVNGSTGYPITCSLGGLAAGNYSFGFVGGKLTVTKKQLTVTADDKSREYGAASPSFTATITGFANSETLGTSGVTGTPSCSTAAVATSPVNGSTGYPITCSLGGLAAGNYSFGFVGGKLTVTKKQLTVTADDKSREYGAASPSFTATITGFANSETLGTSGVTGTPSCSTAAVATSPVNGSTGYPITCSLGGLAAGNYSFGFVGGKLTVTKKQLTVTADDKSSVYSDPIATFTASYSGFVNGETLATSGVTGSPSLTSTATTASPASTYDINAALGSLGSSNYGFTFAKGTLTIAKEDAKIEYTGDTLMSTGSTSTSSTTTVKMAALVTEDQDGHLGSQLQGQKVRFTLYASNDTSLGSPKGSCDATLGAAVDGKASGSCNIAGVGADNWIVKQELVSNSFYTAPQEDAAVTVVIAGTGFTTGGGWITEPTYGTKSNFGFTAKYQKNGGVQGNSLYIYRKTLDTAQTINGVLVPKGEYNWIVKANVMDALNQTCPTGATVGCKATFTGKSNITAVNRATGVAYSLGGNRQFQVDVTDNGEPGSKAAPGIDTYAIKVWDSSGTYYQLGTPTTQKPLEGGNIQVRP